MSASRHRGHSRRAPLRGEAGVTLMELVVSMSITAVSLVIIAGSFVAMYRSTSKAESISDTSSQVAIAFNRLDSSIRYAAAISQPGEGSDGNWYVEWSGAVPSSPDCTQLRLDTASRQLQQRTWNIGADSRATNLSPWQPLAGELQADAASAEPPFALATDAAMPHQQLVIHLRSANPESLTAATADFAVTFTALNSLQSTDPTSICRQTARS